MRDTIFKNLIGRFKFTIRVKLLFLSIAILSIPYVGFEYLRELERYLRDALEISLSDAARAMAGPLHEQQNLFPVRADTDGGSLYVHTLNHPVQLDGYTDDWIAYLSWSDIYSADQSEDLRDKDASSFRLIVSRYQQYYNVLLQVKDSNVIYQNPNTPDAIDNDHVIFVFTNPAGELKRYYFSPAAPGRIRPFKYEKYWDEFNFEYQTSEYITNVTGEWQQTDEGYNLEIAIPKSLLGERMGFIVANVDAADTRVIVSEVGTAGEATVYKPGRLLQSSPEINQIIKTLGKVDGRRFWVLDNHGQVLASGGSLEKDTMADPVNLLYSYILPSVHKRFRDDLYGASRLQGQEVIRAAQGYTETRWRSSPDGKAIIVSAATPVWVNDEVRGVVVVEETTNNIQLFQRHAMASLFDKTLLVFFLVTTLLLLFATRLSYRLRRLSREAESAIDAHGRVINTFQASKSNDEIGELSRNYAAMLDRLRQYNDYLEGMASKLSHELRTPIAVVKSSLDRLKYGDAKDVHQLYLERASEGIERLNLIVMRLSEATRLEQALQSAEKQQTDIGQLIGCCVEGYRLAYPGNEFMLTLADELVTEEVSPDLIVQMLDKLVANAIDFSTGEKRIEVNFLADEEMWKIQIVNYGSQLPELMEQQLFNSMISVRNKKNKNEPHLGLGLYIVRLIAEYHKGDVHASNLSNGQGVMFTLKFPRLNS